MKSLAAIACVFATWVLRGPVIADTGLRTNINPALLYTQAIQVMPDRSVQEHLFTNEWRGRELDARFNSQIASYDNAFKLLRHAARQKVPCDWGYDLTQGPELLLPSLAKSKLLAQAARLRLRWHLENGRPDDARDDLLAAFVLGRQTSKDGILISTLVQFAIENILTSGIAENWYRLSPETLRQVMDGIDAAPPRGTIAQCVATERIAFKDWLGRRVRGFQADSRDEMEALQKTRELLKGIMSGEEASDGPAGPTPEAILQSAGGTTTGLLRQLAELDALYDEVSGLMAAPYSTYLPGMKAFNRMVSSHPYPIVHVFFPAFEKCRLKEFRAELKQASLRAALAYRKSGAAGLAEVLDPLLQVPFHVERFELNGVSRGFKLTSGVEDRDWNAQIYVEHDGPAFNLDGPRVGELVKPAR